MAQQSINLGTPNNEDGDFVRDAFSKAQSNFTELYGKTNTSDFINDGENGTSTFVETDELGATAFSNNYNDLDDKPIFTVVENEYADISALYTDQANQTDTFIQYVLDARTPTEISNGDTVYSKYFEYLGTTNGDVTDYRLLSDNETIPLEDLVHKSGTETITGLKTFTNNLIVGSGAEFSTFKLGTGGTGGVTNGGLTFTMGGGGVTVTGSPLVFNNVSATFSRNIQMGNAVNSKLLSYNQAPVFSVREINGSETGQRIGVLNIGVTEGSGSFSVTTRVKNTLSTTPSSQTLIGSNLTQVFDAVYDNTTYQGLRVNPTFNDNGNTITNILGINYETGKAAASNHYSFISNVGKVKFGEYGDGTVTGTATYGAAFDADGKLIEVPLGGGSGGAVDSVNGQTGNVVLDADDISDTSTTNKFVTATEKGLIGTALQPSAISNEAYDATTWNGVDSIAPSKDAVRDKFESISTSISGLVSNELYDSDTWNNITDIAPSKHAIRNLILNSVVATTGNQTVFGYKTFNNHISLSASSGISFIDNYIINPPNAPFITRRNNKLAFMFESTGGAGRPYAIFDGSLFSGGDKTFTFPNKSGTIALLDDIVGGGSGDYSEWATYSGTRAGSNLSLTLGDYDNSGNGSKISINDATGSITLTGAGGNYFSISGGGDANLSTNLYMSLGNSYAWTQGGYSMRLRRPTTLTQNSELLIPEGNQTIPISVNGNYANSAGDITISTGGSTTINTEFQAETYASTFNYAFDPENPNKFVDLAGNIIITMSGTVNGDSGILYLNRASGTETIAFGSGTAPTNINYPTGAADTVELYFIHTDSGLQWYLNNPTIPSPLFHTFTGGESSYNFGTVITTVHQIFYGTTTSPLLLLMEGVHYTKSGNTITLVGFTAVENDVIAYYSFN